MDFISVKQHIKANNIQGTEMQVRILIPAIGFFLKIFSYVPKTIKLRSCMRKMQYLLMPLEKSSEGTELVLCNLGELSGRLHRYTDNILYILGLVRIVTRVSRTIDAKR